MPSSSGTPSSEQYSQLTGLVYVFNLIVGTGCLTLPAAFASAGWLVSACGILLLAILSYVSATWVLESMACANAVNHWRRVKTLKKRGQVDDELVTRTIENSEADRQPISDTSEEHDDQDEDSLLISEGSIERTVGEYYVIQERIEMGEMAKLFYSKGWVKVFYIILCIYLYGDLAIYEAAVAKSLRDITCSYVGENCSIALTDSDPCFTNMSLTRMDVYRIFVGIFVGCMGPFAFCNLSKTKYMQMFTTLSRWIAMGTMICWAVILLLGGQGKGNPPVVNVDKIPELFGVCIYSFMCHHSLPSLITPISDKRGLFKTLAADYFVILIFYNLLSLTGIFAFSNINDLYTLNFQPHLCSQNLVINALYCVQVYLMLFPVFTLSTSFPIIAITLRNNLKGLVLRDNRRYSFFVYSMLFPILAIVPPTFISLVTCDLELLVGITGAFAGSFIQYVVPATLVYFARKSTLRKIGMGVNNPFKSPLQKTCFLGLICLWALLCQIFVTYYLFTRAR